MRIEVILVLRRDFINRPNTNTAPVYGNESAGRMKSRRFGNGQSYSVCRARHITETAYNRRETSPGYSRPFHRPPDELRSRQPGHNQTEQLRRQKETGYFNEIQSYFDKDDLLHVRNLYSDKDSRSSDPQGKTRLTKKVHLSSVHSLLRMRRTDHVKKLRNYRNMLIEKVQNFASRNPQHTQMVQNLLSDLFCSCERNCERCHRLLSSDFQQPYPAFIYNDDASFSFNSRRAPVSGGRQFAIPPKFEEPIDFPQEPTLPSIEIYPDCNNVANYEVCGSSVSLTRSGASSCHENL